jgi:uncharacterized protein (TIGR00369 family)
MEEEGAKRVLTVTWEDPQVSRRDAAAISGLDYLLALKDGRIAQPPAARLIGYRIREVARGRAVFELEPSEVHYNPFATVHGGIMSTLLDSAMLAAVLSTLEIGAACSTLELKVNFIRPVTRKAGPLRCEGSVIHAGQTIATAEGRLFGGQGALCAHAVTTCSISRVARGEPDREGRPPPRPD